ncbi:SDR family oxidoreductase [Lentisphaera profundi]|uniref:SDR family oxidoreductase n=1 Tax=Lentisphaera profundi TaxID=1658616 RepID=A0ABY7VTF0_9BACT|nr:SDR family oxidoreductase [Lentisphaera profundi]WDE97186.1 SDR family oxidoreductase [Lentisphaera profundi]
MNKKLNGHTVIISGAAGDIGRATVMAYAQQGANIAAGDILEPEALSDLRDQVEALGCRFHYQKCDVTEASEVNNWIDQVTEDLGLPDIVVSNAAVTKQMSLREIDVEEWQRQIAINLTGSFNLISQCANRLSQAKKPGRMVVVGSWAAENVHRNLPAYCTSKAGLRMLMKCAAKEYAPDQILINEIAPGIVDAGLSAKIFREKPQIKESLLEQVPLGRFLTPQDIAEQIVYLSSFDNCHITGTILLMDGGLSLNTECSTK